jgi:uncharacterized protein YcaQ
MSTTLTVTPIEVRRLALEVQHLGAERPPATADGILGLVRELGALQLDAANAVAPAQRLILFSRIGAFDARLLERLVTEDRALFEYFAHAASIVPTSDFALHRVLMRTWGAGGSAWDRRVQVWLEANAPLRESLLGRLVADGPLRTGDFDLVPGPPWQTTAWPIARNVERMLEFLWIAGVVVPVGRWRTQRVWELMDRWLPDEVAKAQPPSGELTRGAVERSLRTLGVANERQIDANFTRYRYPDLAGHLCALEADGCIVRVRVESAGEDAPWPGAWWLHVDDRPLLDRIRAAGDEWTGRTTLLAGLDNLVADRQRAERLFGLRFKQLPFVPKRKRGEATSVLLILDGDRFLGRVDARYDRAARTLVIATLKLEPNVPRTPAVAARVRVAFDELGRFLGAAAVRVDAAVPDRWRRTMAG